ncbi:MAG: 3-deoxy-manno-octulosonate cytidylyltransferase [Saprospiraceae bacterium]
MKETMKIAAIIPARYASTRFPGKPLALLSGKPMIQHVYERASSCEKLTRVLVATDDERIRTAVVDFGGEVVMTSPDHPSGTDRLAEAAQWLSDIDIIVNIQGDEPFVRSEQIEQLCDLFDNASTDIATLVTPIVKEESLFSPHVVKAVFASDGKALYFSRNPIPYLRGIEPANWLEQGLHYQHLGLYAYRREVLDAITRLPLGKWEQAESLEQLRWLEAGYRIRVGETPFSSIGIDTPEDLTLAERMLAY